MYSEKNEKKSINEVDYEFLVQFFNKYKKIETIRTFIEKNYVENMECIDFEKVIIDAIFEQLGDSNSLYMTSAEYDNYVMYESFSQNELSDMIIREKIVESFIIRNKIYLKINSFCKGVAQFFFDELKKNQWNRREALIIDLRGNMGGIIEEAIDIVKQIISPTIIAKFKDRSQIERQVYSNENTINIPIYVLVDGCTGSAAELFGAAIKECGRGKLIGKRTYGKATIQKVVKLQDGSGVKLSIAEFFSPHGNKINQVGIEPDYIVKNEDYNIDKLIHCLDNEEFDL